MLVAKLLCGELRNNGSSNIDPELYNFDPNITEEFTEWGNKQHIKGFQDFVLESPIFSKYEISRQVHLMFTLNLMSTMIDGFYNRNDRVAENLEIHSDFFSEKDTLVRKMNDAATFINRLRLKEKSSWYTKSNSFSLFIAISQKSESLKQINHSEFKQRLIAFENNVSEEYSLAAKEGVNNKKERLLRNEEIANKLF